MKTHSSLGQTNSSFPIASDSSAGPLLRFAYERRIEGRILNNGLREGLASFDRWTRRVDEYGADYCAGPLMNLLRSTGVRFEESLVSECIASRQRFIYPIEILGSNPTWLVEGLYDEYSPWPSISDETKVAIRDGLGTILITHLKKQTDSIRGDPMTYRVFERLHKTIEHFGLPPSSICYVGVSPELPQLYENFVSDKRITAPLRSVQAINYFEKGWQTYFADYLKNGALFDRAECRATKDRLRPRKFLCFNREPRVHRKLHLMWMKQNQLLEQGLVSFLSDPDALRFDKENELPLDAEFQALMANYDSFREKLPLLVDATPGFQISFCRRWPFADTYFSILTERVLHSPHGWSLLTPKVFKAICNMHPFVVIGQQGYLAALRADGYQTFSPFIDESYDEIADPVLRIKAAWAEIQKLCALSTEDLHRWNAAQFSILEHNWFNFLRRIEVSPYDQHVAHLRTLC